MHSINALELPEIAQSIASYLRNLEPCLTVCKSWRSLYLPYYWHEVEAGIRTHSIHESLYRRKDNTPFFDSICHGHYIKFVRVLTVYNDFDSINPSLDYPNLHLLRLYCQWGEWTTTSDKNTALKDFVNRHPLLECLGLYNIPPDIMDSVWTALVDHPRLEKVSLDDQSPVSDDFWRVCSRLRTLEICYSDQQHIPNDLMLPSIRRLKVEKLHNMEFMKQLDLITACPLLEDLEWIGYSDQDGDWTMFAQLATKGIWPHLRQLTLFCQADDADLAQVIASMHTVTKIDISGTPFGPLSFAALRRHVGTLRHLSIPDTANSGMIRDVLCTFTRLEHLNAPRINATDIVESGPWTCTFLKKLSVMISFSSEEDNLQPAVFERISRLVHLEELIDWDFRARVVAGERGLSFRLQSGMAALASLSRLRYLRVNSNNQAMDSDDVRWIIGHWKGFETIRGRLNQDASILEQLKLLFSTSGREIEAIF